MDQRRDLYTRIIVDACLWASEGESVNAAARRMADCNVPVHVAIRVLREWKP
jgi:hypothetical protein